MENHLRPWGCENTAAPDVSKQNFIQINTRIMSPPLVPEVKLHLADEAVPLWQKTEDELGEMGLPPPFWAFAWAGGQALARYILDNPGEVSSFTVLDLATGSGLVGIAAALAGGQVVAADIDAFATLAAEMNAKMNDVKLDIVCEDLLARSPAGFDVVLVGDLFYEKTLAERCLAWLRLAQAQGSLILIGDPGRSYLPKEQLEKLAEYSVPVTRDLEDAEIKRTAVWRLQGPA
jgi:predicted nicotinamide N-methyase